MYLQARLYRRRNHQLHRLAIAAKMLYICPSTAPKVAMNIVSFTDVDECELGICDENATCKNAVGGFNCSCNQGFTGDGLECISKSDILKSIWYNILLKLWREIYMCEIYL